MRAHGITSGTHQQRAALISPNPSCHKNFPLDDRIIVTTRTA
jgi:hypothetical protein